MSKILIEEGVFGKLPNTKQQVKKYTMTNKNDFSVCLISYGASIQAINIKDKNGKLTNLALGFNTIEEYANNDLNPHFGAIIGRTTNRISNAEFKLNGETYKLEKNNGNSCLHGGSSALSRKNWASSIVDNSVKFSYVSPDGDGGYPGELWVDVLYKLDENENQIIIEYKAITDKPTPVNLTNHVYLNLNGHDSSSKIYNHFVKIESDNYLEINSSDTTCTGKILPVEKTNLDFRDYKKLADKIQPGVMWPESGFDHFWIARNNKKELKQVVSAKNPDNGLRVDIASDQLGVHVYTGNYLDLKNLSNNASYGMHHGIAFELHNYPDSVNHESFPSCILNPDEEYYQKTIYTFSVDS